MDYVRPWLSYTHALRICPRLHGPVVLIPYEAANSHLKKCVLWDPLSGYDFFQKTIQLNNLGAQTTWHTPRKIYIYIFLSWEVGRCWSNFFDLARTLTCCARKHHLSLCSQDDSLFTSYLITELKRCSESIVDVRSNHLRFFFIHLLIILDVFGGWSPKLFEKKQVENGLDISPTLSHP